MIHSPRHKTAFTLSVIIIILAALASGGGLFWDGVYQDPPFFRSAFQGNDLVTLVLVVPLLIVTLFMTRRGSQRAQLVWPALLGYMLYNYAFYLFGALFNRFFQVYVALFALSMYGLIYLLGSLDVEDISRKFGARTPTKWVGAYLFFNAGFLGVMELSRSLSLWLHGTLPKDPTLVFALDLSLIVPAMALGAIWLWRRRPWGFILGVMLTVKGATYGLALLAMVFFVGRATGEWDPLAPFYGFVAAGGILGAWGLLRSFSVSSTD